MEFQVRLLVKAETCCIIYITAKHSCGSLSPFLSSREWWNRVRPRPIRKTVSNESLNLHFLVIAAQLKKAEKVWLKLLKLHNLKDKSKDLPVIG